jgi:hypothetical protein
MHIAMPRFTIWQLMSAIATVGIGLAFLRFVAEVEEGAGMALLGIWAIHAAIRATLSAPVVFLGRERARWSRWDLLAFILPFGVWLGISIHAEDGKTLANLVEPIYFSVAISIAALARVVVGPRVRGWACSLVLVDLLCLAAAGVYWWTPPLPE